MLDRPYRPSIKGPVFCPSSNDLTWGTYNQARKGGAFLYHLKKGKVKHRGPGRGEKKWVESGTI
jgi:hypothetical protein